CWTTARSWGSGGHGGPGRSRLVAEPRTARTCEPPEPLNRQTSGVCAIVYCESALGSAVPASIGDDTRSPGGHYIMVRRFGVGLLSAVLALAVPQAAAAQAQAINGNIEGTVRDTSGSALPGVMVTVTNME